MEYLGLDIVWDFILNMPLGFMLALVGVVAFFESLALVGWVIPAVPFFFALAVLAGEQLVPLRYLLGVAYIGAVLGDQASYFIGSYFKERVYAWHYMEDKQEWVDRARWWLKEYGFVGIVIGRFIGPVRPVLPMMVGILGMPPHIYFCINLFSAAGWACAYLLPGYLVGSVDAETTVGFEFLIVSVILFLSIFAVYKIGVLLYTKASHYAQQNVDRLRNLHVSLTPQRSVVLAWVGYVSLGSLFYLIFWLTGLLDRWYDDLLIVVQHVIRYF